MSKNIILVFIAGLIIGGAGFYLAQAHNNILSSRKASEAAIGFINNAIEAEDATASLLDVVEESGIYKLHIKIRDNEYDSYITKDGRYLFSTAFDLRGVQSP